MNKENHAHKYKSKANEDEVNYEELKPALSFNFNDEELETL